MPGLRYARETLNRLRPNPIWAAVTTMASVVGLALPIVAILPLRANAQSNDVRTATADQTSYVRPQPARPPITELQVAVWNMQHLSEKEAATLKKKQRPKRTTWRNTFGAERKSSTWRTRGRIGIEADVIALLGATSVQDVRRMFPARTHHVVISRAALMSLDAGYITSTAGGTETAGFAVVAIRRKAGVRMSGQYHFTAPRLHRAIIPQHPPDLAVRIRLGGNKSIWIASLGLRSDCQVKPGIEPTPDCDGERLAMTCPR